MTSYNVKCKGCGAYLNDDKTQTGYVPKFDADKTKLCYRCFRLKNYNELITPENIKQSINQTFTDIDFSGSIAFLIIDVLNIKHSLIDIPKNVDKFIIIVNKMDVLPNYINWETTCNFIRDIIDSYNVKYDELIFTSIKSKTSIKKIDDILCFYGLNNQKCFFIGKSNVGKSSIINALLNINNIKHDLTVSSAINTTINLQKIKFKKYSIIDTPGLLSNDNILSYIDHNKHNQVFNNKEIKPGIYQIKYPKSIKVENLVQINVYPKEEFGTVTIFANAQLNVSSSKIKEEVSFNNPSLLNYSKDHLKNIKFKTHTFTFDKLKNDISIAGLGLFCFKNIEKIEITLDENIAIDRTPFAII
ncbi:MAG: GTPase [Mycoplasma sp.]